ncbi:MAG: HDIG domain-containing metalloprotein, partial [Desulfatiglandales bacterium]
MNPLKSLLERIKRPRRAKTVVVSLSQKRPVRFLGLRQNLPKLSLLMVTSIFFAFLMNTGLWTVHHEYKVGDIAERDIKASHDFLVEDKEATEKNRTDISKTVLSSYDYDPTANFLLEKITEAFSKARESLANLGASSGSEVEDTKLRIKEEFFFLLGIHPDETLFEMLWKLKFSAQVESILTMLLKDVYEIGIINFANFPANEMQKGIVLKNVITGSESVVVAFDRFLDIEEARQIIKQKIKESKVDNYTKQVLLRIAPLFVQPNITYNRRQTMLRMEAAKSSVKPFYQIVKKGEIIIREGERITPIHLQKLAEESRQKRPIDLVWRLAGSSLVNVVFLLFTYYVGLSKRGRKYYSTKDLVFLSGLLILFGLLCTGIWFSLQNLIRLQPDLSLRIASYVLPVASVGLIVSIFKGISAAVTVGTVFCIFASTTSGNMLQMVFYFLTGTMLGVYNVRFAKERKNIILAAIKIASVNGAVAVGVELSLSQVSHLSLVGAFAAGLFGGILSGVFTTGLLPLIEMIFGYTNNIKLIELASLDSPLIKELMLQAPGTYHHSVVVSSLSEAAASSVGANPILCKVASLYHDIGKTKMPQYFVENQGGGENKHERLAPSMSALILLSHVRDGVELAGKAKLPQEIIDII